MWRDPRLEASDGAPASSPPRSPTSFDPAYASETMRRSYEAHPPHHAWAPGYYYSGLGPGDAPECVEAAIAPPSAAQFDAILLHVNPKEYGFVFK